MNKNRRKHSAEFKVKVVLDLLKSGATLSEIAGKHEVHPAQITKWKGIFLENAPELFSQSSGGNGKKKAGEDVESELYKKIGQLQMELDWLKKKSVDWM